MRLAREGGFGGRGWGRVPACLEPGELSREVGRLSISHYGSTNSTTNKDLISSPDRSQAGAFVICTDWLELKLLPFTTISALSMSRASNKEVSN